MRYFVKTHLFNVLSSFVLGLAFINMPSNFVVTHAHAACDDTAGPAVNWENCRKRNLIMDGFDFSGSNFTRSDLSASDLRNSNFSKAIFVKTNLVRASLAGSSAENSNFEGVTGSRTDFSKSNFQNSSFAKAEISRSNFSESNLQDSDMSKADFSRVDFSNANLKGVNLSFSNISRANLINIELDKNLYLKGAYMFLTLIEDLDLSGIKGIEQWQINMACGNENTMLPDGLTRPHEWPCQLEAN